ncbi:integrase [Vibrio breoganii]|uniref:integrase n=1 Tax=Vibrio breoganii TaxID=553239 RepID=UPI000C86517B|nr:integrase [Vibrio breoganii]PMK20447.1 integrase [Vibrio breoganii]
MIKISNLDHLKSIKNPQNKGGKHTNYLLDILAPAIEKGDWDEFECLEIGFDTSGESLGKIGNDMAWRKLQPFFEPNAAKAATLDFSLDGRVIERNLKNELKALILKMLWTSPKEYSFETVYQTLTVLKKFVTPLLSEGVNSFSYIDFFRLSKWISEEKIDLNFRRERTYTPINKLVIEAKGLPFSVALSKTLGAGDFNLTLFDNEQYPVIPQRLYYLALRETESLIERLYPIRDEIEALSTYLTTYHEKVYEGYAKYLHRGTGKLFNGDYIWRLTNSNKGDKTRNLAFINAFSALKSPTEDQILELLQTCRPAIQSNFHSECYPASIISIDGKTVSNARQATTLLVEYSGGCIWSIIARSGMRVDEAYHLHPVKGCQKEIISGQTIYVLNADLSKTVIGLQSKQDEFVTTELGMKAFAILQSIHSPLRKCHPESKRFFHTLKLMNGFCAAKKKALSSQTQRWFNRAFSSELSLTREDIKDLQISSPASNFEVGEQFEFSCHQLRRSFAYYLIGYELLSFPQLKQQFSHVSLAMTRHYAKNASKFQKLRKKTGKKNLCSIIDDERVHQKAQLYLDIYNRLSNKERVAGGKGKEFAKRRAEYSKNNLFTDRANKGKSNNMLTLEYWENVIRNGQRHIHVVAPGIYCTSVNCSLRTQVSLIECVDCDSDYIVDAVYAEAMRKEAEEHMHYDIMYNELTPQTASESYIKITAAQRIMDDLGMDYEPVAFPKVVLDLLIPHTGVPT